MKFSIAITTYKRFDTFLRSNLIKYLSSDIIDKIYIVDDCSNDNEKIINDPELSKYLLTRIFLYTNDKNLGVYGNKITLMSIIPKDEWVAFIDSDNYVDERYFNCLQNRELSVNKVYCPGWAYPSPNLDYRKREYTEIDKTTWNKYFNINDAFFNTMNFFIHGSVCNKLAVKSKEYNDKPTCLDSIFILHKLVRDIDCTLRLEREMIYDHAVHNGSSFVEYQHNFAKEAGQDWTV